MNQSQRNFLIEKIQEKAEVKRRAIKSELDGEQPPSLSLFLFHKVMSDDYDIASKEEIKQMIKDKALKGTDRDDWLGNHWGSGSKDNVFFPLLKFFKVPEEWQKQWDEYHQKKTGILQRERELNIEVDTLITRIKLASNSVLQSLISEVDDMGNISLMDTKLKQLTQ